jgi:lipopolysaccharide transport system permease protein
MAAIHRITIRPSTGFRALGLAELWSSVDLLYFLVWRDVKVRYKQTLLGAAWAVLQPLMTMGVFTLFFGRLSKMPSDSVPYSLFCYTALVPWMFFANGVTAAANSLITNANLLKKVYFPRLILPLASVGGVLMDLAIAFSVLVVMALAYGFFPTARVLLVPLVILLAIISAVAAGLWLAAVNIKFRDVRYALPFLIQFWMFATPIAYPSSLIKNEIYRTLYGLNPMTGVVEGMRWALLDTDQTPGPMIAVSSAIAVFAMVTGAFYFRRVERSFADVA